MDNLNSVYYSAFDLDSVISGYSFLKLRKDNTLTTNDSQVPSSDGINLHTDDCACKYLHKYVACFEYDSFEDERLVLNINTIYIRLQKD